MNHSTEPGGPSDATVDLELLRAPEAGRAAYAAARDLVELAAGQPFSSIKRALDAGSGVLLPGVSRQVAEEALGLLQAHGGEGRIVPAGTVAARAPARVASQPAARWAGFPSARQLTLVAGAALALLAGWLFIRFRAGQSPELRGQSGAPAAALSAREIGARASRGTALVRRGESLGSGFFVEPELLVTAAHVLGAAGAAIEVTLESGAVFPAVIEREDRWLDVALVRVAGAAGAEPLALGDAAVLAQGDPVYFYGNPRGLEFTLGRAIVSHAARDLQGLSYLQLDGNVHPGNSGGPLLDPQGAVIGVVTMRVGDEAGLGLALPINYLYTATDSGTPLLSAPAQADHSAWQAFLERAAVANRKQVADVHAQQQQPMLASAFVRSDGALLAIVLRQSPTEPPSETLQFRLAIPGEGDAGDCALGTSVSAWEQAGTAAELDERTRLWLEKNQLTGETWAAMVALDADTCPDTDQLLGATLELPVAPPAGRRAEITLLDPIQSLLAGADAP